jgi:hypothetical protein
MVKKLNPEVQQRKIKKASEKEKKDYEKHLKSLEKAKSKRTPQQQAYYEYIDKMNRLGQPGGTTKKEVEESRKKAYLHMKTHSG